MESITDTVRLMQEVSTEGPSGLLRQVTIRRLVCQHLTQHSVVVFLPVQSLDSASEANVVSVSFSFNLIRKKRIKSFADLMDTQRS